MVNADPARTPTLAMFAKPDYFLQPTALTGACAGLLVCQNTGFAWDHGDYAAEIDTNYFGIAGPGVRHLGLDGSGAADGPSSAGPNSGQVTVPDSGTRGTWVDETDIRPTLMYLTGLRDDYEHDGRVITQILSHPNAALSAPGVADLGACYKQLNSSVGEFGTDTLQAATKAIESTSPGDSKYLGTDAALRQLELGRDHLALRIKGELEAAAFGNAAVPRCAAADRGLQAHHRGRAPAGQGQLISRARDDGGDPAAQPGSRRPRGPCGGIRRDRPGPRIPVGSGKSGAIRVIGAQQLPLMRMLQAGCAPSADAWETRRKPWRARPPGAQKGCI